VGLVKRDFEDWRKKEWILQKDRTKFQTFDERVSKKSAINRDVHVRADILSRRGRRRRSMVVV
jgi:predicted GH43/DUF377 family glycosyl hydrolase